MRLTSKQCTKYFGAREDHEFRGYNKALGKFIEGKEHFIHEMEKGGYVPFEMGERMAEEHRKTRTTDYTDISDKTKRVIADLKSTSGKGGKLSSLSGTKRACESVGVKFDHRLPSHYADVKVGGFE
jgi:hypothetical protein